MRRVAALLRAVNVGGRKLAMADLRKLLETEGFADPETLLASGNAVFGTPDPSAAVERRLEAALARTLDLRTEVLVRDGLQLGRVLAGNPFAEMAKESPSRLMVVFLRGEPRPALDDLKGYCGLGEEVAPGPGCLYVAYPGGSGVSKLGLAVIEKRLAVTGTGRNWNTVVKLAERVGGVAR